MNLELLGKVTVILCAAGLGGLLLRRSSAAARHLVQVLGLGAALALPLLAVALPAWELPLLDPPEAEHAIRSELAPLAGPEPTVAPRSIRPERQELPQPVDGECDCESATPSNLTGGERDETLLAAYMPRTPGGGSKGASPMSWIPWLWALGAAAVLGRLGFGWLRMTRLAIDATPLECSRTWQLVDACRRRLGLRAAPRVLTSSAVRVPVLWGFLRPTLLLPVEAISWPTARLRVVLLHEMAHLRRRDGLALLVGRLSAAAWWFHPMVWLVERGARRDCERACDDVVLACGERASNYAEQLLGIARELPPAAAAPAGALAVVTRGQLGNRLQSILHPRLRRGLGRRAAVALLSIVVVGLVSVSSVQLVARPSAPAEEPVTMLAKGESAGEIMLAHDEHGEHDEEGERIFEQAYELHEAEKFDEAREAFLEAAEAGYRTGTSLYNAACGFARMGDTSRAIELIERSMEAGFDSWELLYEDSDLDPIRRDASFRAMMDGLREEGRLHHGDRYEEARERYQEMLDAGSTEGHEWYDVGSELLRLRDFEAGIDALDRANRYLDEKNSNALYNLACAYALKGDSRQALDHLERAVLAGFDSEERFRNDSDLDSIRGERRFEEIEAVHDKLSLDRYRKHGKSGSWTNWREWTGIGREDSEYSDRRWEPAVEEFTDFTRENPAMGRAWFNLGWALHFSHRHAEARDAFTKQLELGYRPSNATYNIACTYAMEDNAAEALNWLERAVETERVGLHQLMSDSDLRSLHDEPRFEQLLDRLAESEDAMERFEHRRKVKSWKVKKKEAKLY